MKFSIVTISYNQAQYLNACIESVLNQSYINFEYIVVDPGSDDESRDIINSYSDERIVRVYEPDNGPADGLGKGFSRATGDVFLYINADDLLEKNALSIIAGAFGSEDYGEQSIIYGGCKIISGSGDIVREVASDDFSLNSSAYNSAVVIQPSTFFTKRAYELSPGFNAENRSNWDDELFIDMVIAGASAYRHAGIFSSYRVHEEGITGSGKLKEAHEKYFKARFRKIKRRDWNKLDCIPWLFYRCKKHLSNMKQLKARLKLGPIFGEG